MVKNTWASLACLWLVTFEPSSRMKGLSRHCIASAVNTEARMAAAAQVHTDALLIACGHAKLSCLYDACQKIAQIGGKACCQTRTATQPHHQHQHVRQKARRGLYYQAPSFYPPDCICPSRSRPRLSAGAVNHGRHRHVWHNRQAVAARAAS